VGGGRETEETPEDYFNAQLRRIIKKMGSRTTSTDELEKMGRRLFRMQPKFFVGVHAAKDPVPHYYGAHFFIRNVMDRPPGKHWVGVYRDNGVEILYDSFGRLPLPGNDLHHFVGMQTTETDAEQPISTHPDMQFCGQACLAFGLVAQKYGLRGAKAI